MSYPTHPIAASALFTRSVMAVLLGATMLASPFALARADTATDPAIRLAQAAPQNPATTEPKDENVEQRIVDLHKALKITPDQEAKWNAVAQAMRENDANMDKLVTAYRASPPKTALDDLKAYQKHAQAHTDGLKNLISSFEQLYAAMPDAQRKNADEVFKISDHGGAPRVKG